MTDKETAKMNYIEAMNAWVKDRTDENWYKFCEAKIICRRLGITI